MGINAKCRNYSSMDCWHHHVTCYGSQEVNSQMNIIARPQRLIEGNPQPQATTFVYLISLVDGMVSTDITNPNNEVLFAVEMHYLIDIINNETTISSRTIVTDGEVYWDIESEYPWCVKSAIGPSPDKNLIQNVIKRFLKDLNHE